MKGLSTIFALVTFLYTTGISAAVPCLSDQSIYGKPGESANSIPTAQACRAMCDKYSSCVAWEWFPADYRTSYYRLLCTTFKIVLSRQTDARAVSGLKGCTMPGDQDSTSTTSTPATTKTDSTSTTSTTATTKNVATNGGNANGASCVFPFNYKGKKYLSCTKIDHKVLWCATTSDYSADKKWGNCIQACQLDRSYSGNPTKDYTIFKTATAKGCRDKCAEDKSCVVWEWDTPESRIPNPYYRLVCGTYVDFDRNITSVGTIAGTRDCLMPGEQGRTSTTSAPSTTTKIAVGMPQYASYSDRTCEKKWVKVGCYDTKVRGAMLVYWRWQIKWSSIDKFAHSLVCACAEAAKASGATHFATHFWGECFAINKANAVPQDGGACTLADGSYQKKCTAANINNKNECLGRKHYYVYKTT